jgi:hypothetical protein
MTALVILVPLQIILLMTDVLSWAKQDSFTTIVNVVVVSYMVTSPFWFASFYLGRIYNDNNVKRLFTACGYRSLIITGLLSMITVMYLLMWNPA